MNTIVRNRNGLETISIEASLRSNRTLFITDEITDQAALDLTKQVLYLLRENAAEPINLIINSSGGSIEADGRLPHAVNIICDDFGTSPIQGFPDMISIMREKNISTTILLQSLSQLENTYGSASAITVCNNCDRMVYLGSNDLSSADEISRRADAPLQDVLNMPLGQEYFFEWGRYPVLTKSYDVFADATYKEMLKVSAAVEREEAEQKRKETDETMKELAEMEAALKREEEAFQDLIANLGNLDEE